MEDEKSKQEGNKAAKGEDLYHPRDPGKKVEPKLIGSRRKPIGIWILERETGFNQRAKLGYMLPHPITFWPYPLNFKKLGAEFQTGIKGDPIFDAYYQSNVQFIVSGTEHERTMREAGIALLDKIGPSILITHSQGGLYGWAIADARPSKVKALIQIEPKGPPSREAVFSTDFTRPWGLTSIPLAYSPTPTNLTAPLTTQVIESDSTDRTSCIIQAEPALKLPNLAKVPILIDSGEASYHAMYDYCFILFLKQAGVKAEHLELGKLGLRGNGHLQFMEKNSDDIAEVLFKWIKKTVKN